MGSSGSKTQPTGNSNNNAGQTSDDKKTNEPKTDDKKTNEPKTDDQTKLPPLSPPASTSEIKKSLSTENTKLPQVSNKQTGAEQGTSKGNTAEESKGDKSEVGKANPNTTEDDFIEPEDQRKFDDAISAACTLVKPESLMKKLTKNVTKLQLSRALPWNYNFYDILSKLTNLQEVDISNNNIGPQSFRSICLAMSNNTSVSSLNLADNMADTDSAECLGRMLTQNKTLVYLNISSNNLGKDYFSRCVGPALKVNNTLQTLRAQSIGSTDLKVFLGGLKENKTVTDIDLSNNPLSDRAILGKGLGEKLKDSDCILTSIALASCEMNAAGIDAFVEGFKCNTSLQELNLNGNEFESLKRLGKLVTIAMNSTTMRNLSLEKARIKDTSVSSTDIKMNLEEDTKSQLQILSLNDSNLTDNFWTSIKEVFQGRQIPLQDINIGSNTELSTKSLEAIAKLTSDSENISSLRKVNFSLNTQCTGLSEVLGKQQNLQYVNVRRCRIKDLHLMSQLYTAGSLTTLVLDNLKMASTDTLQKLLENAKGSSLRTLSLGGCSLSAEDIAPLCQAIKKGVQLHMLKLSANRLEDQGVIDLSQALSSCKTHPLAVLDLSSNTFGDVGAQSLSKNFTAKGHKSEIHSLNVTSNNIGKDGLLSLVSAVGGKSPLHRLYAQNQKHSFIEADMVEVFKKLATGLGFNIKKIGASCSDLPNLPEGLLINLSSLGGVTGDIGAMLDSLRIVTDYPNDKEPTMTFGHVQELCASLKNSGSSVCVWSSEEWGLITGSSKSTNDAPSWLQLEGSRSKALYLSNLAGNTTQQKMDAMFEMEADCNLDEVCLMKDPITRSINGIGWMLMADDESVKKAVDFFNSGAAKVFGQPFKISRIIVKVDDEANSLAESQAKEDFEKRQQLKQQEAQEYKFLIQRSTEESWKRHAYRLAHPAYADGRIW